MSVPGVTYVPPVVPSDSATQQPTAGSGNASGSATGDSVTYGGGQSQQGGSAPTGHGTHGVGYYAQLGEHAGFAGYYANP